MKHILGLFIDLIHQKRSPRDRYHNDALRANQFNDSAASFSFWRSLVS